jgi:hypothetical protein
MKVKLTKHNDSVIIDKHDLDDLDVTLSKVILPALQSLKKVKNDIPQSIWREVAAGKPVATEKQVAALEARATSIWIKRLDKMILAFSLIKNGGENKKRDKIIKEGLSLFAEHYMDLWY